VRDGGAVAFTPQDGVQFPAEQQEERRQHPPPRQWLWRALLTGGLPLLYGNFVLVLPVLLYALWQQLGRRWPRRREWLLGFGIMALFLLPTISWILVLKLRGVTYYNHEVVRYRQLVWLLDAVQTTPGEFLDTVGNKALEFVNTLRGIWVLLVAVPLLWLVAGRRTGKLIPLVKDAPVLLALFAGFLLALGYYNERLTFTLQPLLLFLGVAALARLRLPAQGILLLIAALGWHAYQVLSYGPFS